MVSLAFHDELIEFECLQRQIEKVGRAEARLVDAAAAASMYGRNARNSRSGSVGENPVSSRRL